MDGVEGDRWEYDPVGRGRCDRGTDTQTVDESLCKDEVPKTYTVRDTDLESGCTE